MSSRYALLGCAQMAVAVSCARPTPNPDIQAAVDAAVRAALAARASHRHGPPSSQEVTVAGVAIVARYRYHARLLCRSGVPAESPATRIAVMQP